MRNKMTGLCSAMFIAGSLAGCSLGGSDKENTEQLYNRLLSGDVDVSVLNLFMTQMPKGGDIHHHYSGALYAENYLDWVTEDGWFIDSCTLHVVQANQPPSAPGCEAMTVAQVKDDNDKYRDLLSLWSDLDYADHFHDEPAPDTNFFDTFAYFSGVADANPGEGLQILKQRAIAENVSYIETMFETVGFKQEGLYDAAKVQQLNNALRTAQGTDNVAGLLQQITADLNNSEAFATQLKNFLTTMENAHQGIDDEQFMMRFQTYAVRTLEPLQVFIDLYSGFRASYNSELMVGVNIVAPENNHVSLADYTLHMQMFQYLRENLKPQGDEENRKVNLALHAGELTLGMVTPENLQFHINEAVNIAGAQRIGHGVDIVYEQNPMALMDTMKERNLAVEINLTSNEFILGVKGNKHPYQLYAGYGVPMVISTDDAGVSRNNLANEYVLLASRYAPSYDTVKSYVYNSIEYSFLSDDDKKTASKRLDKQFSEFERKMSDLYQTAYSL